METVALLVKKKIINKEKLETASSSPALLVLMLNLRAFPPVLGVELGSLLLAPPPTALNPHTPSKSCITKATHSLLTSFHPVHPSVFLCPHLKKSKQKTEKHLEKSYCQFWTDLCFLGGDVELYCKIQKTDLFFIMKRRKRQKNELIFFLSSFFAMILKVCDFTLPT